MIVSKRDFEKMCNDLVQAKQENAERTEQVRLLLRQQNDLFAQKDRLFEENAALKKELEVFKSIDLDKAQAIGYEKGLKYRDEENLKLHKEVERVINENGTLLKRIEDVKFAYLIKK